jgi:hypothetical protein
MERHFFKRILTQKPALTYPRLNRGEVLEKDETSSRTKAGVGLFQKPRSIFNKF